MKPFTRKPAPQAANLDESLAAARDALVGATAELGAAALAALENPGDVALQRRKDDAAAALKAAQANVDALAAALPVANSREYQRAQKAQAEALAAKRAIVRENCAIRDRAAKSIEASAAAMAKDYKTLEAACVAIHETGLAPDAEGGLLHASSIQTAVRLAVAKAGNFRWAASGWPWPIEDLPSLVGRITAANQHVLAAAGA